MTHNDEANVLFIYICSMKVKQHLNSYYLISDWKFQCLQFSATKALDHVRVRP